MLLSVAGSFCVVKSPAHLTFHSTRCLTALPWNQRSGRWRLFAARPTIDTTIRAEVRRDRRSLYCDRCSPCRSSGCSVGGEANNWGRGLVATRDPAAAARPSCVLEEMMLTLSSSATSITAVVSVPTFLVGIASFLLWIVPAEKLSSKLNAAAGSTSFFLGYGRSGLCF
jgi:hypothetical protein